MVDEREVSCYQNLAYFYYNNLIMCHYCNRNWQNHISGASCGAAAFYDQAFLPIRRHFYYNPDMNPLHRIRWTRISSFVVNAPFNMLDWFTLINCARPQDAVQGGVKDSWLTAAMAVLSQNRNALRKLFPFIQNEPEGIHNVQIYSFGIWRNVLIDDFVPCDENFYPFYVTFYRKWAALLEKAVAKFYGCYEALNGGTLVESLNLLTGAPCIEIFINNEFGFKLHPDEIWNRVKYALAENYLILASSVGSMENADSDAEFVNMGLLKLHTYCVLSVVQVRGVNLIKLFSPNFTVEYRGQWSYEYLKDKPHLQEFLYADCAEGEFWTEYTIFLQHFEKLCVCKIVNDYNKIAMNGVLVPLTIAKPFGLFFTIKKRMVVDFMLHQVSQRWFSAQDRTLMDLFLIILKKDGAGNYVYYVHSIRIVETILSLDLELFPGDYFIIPISFNHCGKVFSDHLLLRCLLEVFSPDTVFMDKNWYPFDMLKETLVGIAKIHGKANQYKSAVVYEYSHGFAGVIVVIENEDYHRSLSVKCMYVGEPDKYVSTRGAMTTKDIIPPRHTQLIAVLTSNQGRSDVNATDFHYQFDLIDEENVSEQLKHIPQIDCKANSMHTPYLHNGDDQ